VVLVVLEVPVPLGQQLPPYSRHPPPEVAEAVVGAIAPYRHSLVGLVVIASLPMTALPIIQVAQFLAEMDLPETIMAALLDVVVVEGLVVMAPPSMEAMAEMAGTMAAEVVVAEQALESLLQAKAGTVLLG
jgi:hypothetical protein